MVDLARLADDPRKHQNEAWPAYGTRRRFEVCGRVLRNEAIMREYNRQLALAPPPTSDPPPRRRKKKRGRR